MTPRRRTRSDKGCPIAPHADRATPESATREISAALADAVVALGNGFLTHPHNAALRASLRACELSDRAYRDQLAWIAYRLLFVFIADDRGLLCQPDAEDGTQLRPIPARCLRSLAAGEPDPDASDLWDGFGRLASVLATPDRASDVTSRGEPSRLWDGASTPDLPGQPHPGGGRAVRLRNNDLLRAVRALEPVVSQANGQINGTAVLGLIYERLLELEPVVDVDACSFAWRSVGASGRRVRGSFYTPPELVEHVLDTALEPVVADRLSAAASPTERERAILGITVCDPAAGAGHFLIGAARRLATHLERTRSERDGGGAPGSPAAVRDVIANCLFGVDIDPIAATIGAVRLWLEAADPRTPLASLDHRVRVGDALLGATPEVLARGIPDDAFTARGGDAKPVASYYRRRNRAERSEGRHAVADGSHTKLVADAWCAAFAWRLHDTDRPDAIEGSPGAWDAITEGTLRALERDPETIPAWMRDEIERIASDRQFFHWHLEFPEVFAGPDSESGFDVVIGNPPFLNQLESATATARISAAIIAATTGGIAKGYADQSSAFLLLAARLTRPGGRVAMIQPQSLLAAKDARPVRTAVLERGALTHLWIATEQVFEGASVFTCAPTIHLGGPRRGALARTSTIERKPIGGVEIDCDALRKEETWAHLAAAAFGVPEFEHHAAGTVGDLADATADFRDQYYGLEGFLVESDALDHHTDDVDARYPPIVTTGLIDLARCDWSRRPARLLKRGWDAPRIDRARMRAEGALSEWIDRRLVPKIILATQTKVIEVYVDEPGRLVPSLPLITVQPRSRADLWRVAVALASPVGAALALRRYAGAGLTAQAIKLSAKQALALPIPANASAWDAAADLLRRAHATDRPEHPPEVLESFARASIDAFGVPRADAGPLFDWWAARLGIGDNAATRA
ncbi:MAG: N-6 DNA methylase [Phycisphaerales bacterium]